jgi:ELWxxDGT repeat protein
MKKLHLTLFFALVYIIGNAQTFELVKDINETTFDFITYKTCFREVNGKAYYIFYDYSSNNYGLFVSDGTENGTYKVTPESLSIEESNLIVGGNKIFFFGTDSNGKEPWVYNTETQTASMIKDIEPSSLSSAIAGNGKFFSADESKAFFWGNDESTGYELWVTDGTESGTHLVKDFNVGSGNTVIGVSESAYGTNIKDGKLYFFAHSDGYGIEPWVTDGTEEGTFMLKDVDTGSFNSSSSTKLQLFYEYNNEMYFVASQFNSYEDALYKTDGTTAGTTLIKNTGDTMITNFFKKDGVLYFFSNNSGLIKIWTSDGTEEGTQVVSTFPNTFSATGINSIQPVEINGTLYVKLRHDDIGVELFKLDNSFNPVLVKDVAEGSTSGLSTISSYDDVLTLQNYNDKIWFLARINDTSTRQIWMSDGTEEGTIDLTSSLNGSAGNTNDYNMIATSFGVFCIYTNNVTGSELYFYGSNLSNENFTKITPFKTYPNPTQDVLNISEMLNNIEIYNLEGKKVLQSQNTQLIDVSGLTRGTYIIKAQTVEGKNFNSKFVKK